MEPPPSLARFDPYPAATVASWARTLEEVRAWKRGDGVETYQFNQGQPTAYAGLTLARPVPGAEPWPGR